MSKKLTRGQHELLEDFLDGDLPSEKEKEANRLLFTNAAFERELRSSKLLRDDIKSIPSPEPPEFFDRRVLLAAMSEINQPQAKLAGTAVKLYLTLCTLLAAMIFSLSTVLFRGAGAQDKAASGISGLVLGLLEAPAWIGQKLVLAVQSTVGVVTPVTMALRPLFNGLAKTVIAATPALLPYAIVFLVLTSLVFVWFFVSNQRRSTPHATLVL